MTHTIIVTQNERRVIELLRELKAGHGHGTLRIEVRDGAESLFRSERSELPK
jgi:hypothetical protein